MSTQLAEYPDKVYQCNFLFQSCCNLHYLRRIVCCRRSYTLALADHTSRTNESMVVAVNDQWGEFDVDRRVTTVDYMLLAMLD